MSDIKKLPAVFSILERSINLLANFTTSFERIIPAKNTIIAKASTGRHFQRLLLHSESEAQ